VCLCVSRTISARSGKRPGHFHISIYVCLLFANIVEHQVKHWCSTFAAGGLALQLDEICFGSDSFVVNTAWKERSRSCGAPPKHVWGEFF
jgi:hypothetical protein